MRQRKGRHAVFGLGVAALVFLVLAMAGRVRADIDLWPLYQKDNEGTIILYPFYVHEGKFLMMFPLFYRTDEGKDYHFVWPLVKVSEGGLTRAAPLWFSGEEDEYTLFPIIRQTPDYTFWMAPPMYFAKDGDFEAIFPLYVKTRDHTFIAPTIFKTYEQGELKRFQAVPLFDYRRDEGDSREFSTLPVWVWSNDKGETVPLYLAGRKWGGDVNRSHFAPVYYRRKSQDESRLWIMPYYQKRAPLDRVTSLLPLFWKERFKDERILWAFPYFEKESPRVTRRMVPGLFDREKSLSEKTGETRKKLAIFSDLYLREETRSSSGMLLERNRQFLIFSDERERDGGRIFRLLGIPVMERVEGKPPQDQESPSKPPLEARAHPVTKASTN